MFLRRLFSSVPARTNTGVASIAGNPSYLPSASLPQTLLRHIDREVRIAKEDAAKSGIELTSPLNIRNPFLVHSHKKLIPGLRHDISVDEMTSRIQIPMVFPVRRQKKLLSQYPAEVLPPSPTNPLKSNLPIQLADGTVVAWVGEWKEAVKTSLYPRRKKMFKGTTAERTRRTRDAQRAERMAGMEKRVADWRETKKAEKAKAKSSLPF